MTFVKNHAQGIVACDFLVAVTARFQVLFVFVAMEIGSRRILHSHVTAHPTAQWTLQQFREAIPSDHPYRFLIHDRDSIFSLELDQELKLTFGLRVLRTPVRAPQAAFLSKRPAEPLSRGGRDIDCRATARSESRISWAAYITNIGSKSALREPHLVSAEDRYWLGVLVKVNIGAHLMA